MAENLLTVPKSYARFWAYMPFLTFEGIDGSGKSSLMKLLAEALLKKGLPVETTREPGGSDFGPELRKILLRPDGHAPCAQTELLIYEADRAQHVKTKIRPWLEKKIWVLSDRFADSSLAFQGAGRKLALADVAWLNNFATQGLIPDLTFLVDCPVEVSRQRRERRENEVKVKADRFELEAAPFHQAVRDEYLKLAKSESHRFVVLDGQKTLNDLLNKALQALKLRRLL